MQCHLWLEQRDGKVYLMGQTCAPAIPPHPNHGRIASLAIFESLEMARRMCPNLKLFIGRR